MSKKFSDFIFSFGMMLIGVVLVLGGSVIFAKGTVPAPHKLPASRPRINAAVGGDLESVNFPASRPRVPIFAGAAFTDQLTAGAALVVDDQTNTVLFEKDSNTARPVASISKLMSALVLAGLPLPWHATTTVLGEDVDANSHHLAVGDILSLDELWHAALIGSSNSAIVALVRASGFSEAQFVARMNAQAGALHLPTARFVEPTGLSSGNVASAWDTARLLKSALQVERIARPLGIGEYYIQPRHSNLRRRIWSTDWLLNDWVNSGFSPDQIAGKTGYIPESGYNFAVRFSDKKGHRVRVVVLGSATNEIRFSEARDLAEWAFANYLWPDDPRYRVAVE